MAIENSQLATTQLDLLEVPAGKSYAITTVMVCNSSSTDAASFDMHLVKSGEALSNTKTLIVKELNLPAGETFTFDSEKIVLEAGDKLAFVAEPGYPNYGPGGANPVAGGQYTDLVATVSYLEV
jgi:hypothetical protein